MKEKVARAIRQLKKGKTEYFDEIYDLTRASVYYVIRGVLKDNYLVEDAMQNLSDDEFRILELTTIYGYRRVEVAKMLGEPISTINWKYNKVIKKVKTFYGEVYNEK